MSNTTFLTFVKERAFPLVDDVKIDGALVAHSNECFLGGVQHHHGSQLFAAEMDRWPSFLSQHTCEQYGAHLCRPHSKLGATFCIVNKKCKHPPKPRLFEAAPQELRFVVRPTNMNHTGVPESKACEHDEAILRWQH